MSCFIHFLSISLYLNSFLFSLLAISLSLSLTHTLVLSFFLLLSCLSFFDYLSLSHWSSLSFCFYNFSFFLSLILYRCSVEKFLCYEKMFERECQAKVALLSSPRLGRRKLSNGNVLLKYCARVFFLILEQFIHL